jgi:hypothetical protein
VSERLPLSAVVHDRPRRRLALGAAAFPITFLTMILGGTLIGPIGALLGVLLGGAASFALVNYLGSRRVGPTEVEVEPGILRVPALDLTVRSSDVESGLESIAEQCVTLDLANGTNLQLRLLPHDPRLATFDRGARLLQDLGVGPGQRTTRVPLRRTLGAFTIGLVTFMLGMFLSPVPVALGRALLGTTASLGVSLLLLPALATLLVVRRFGKPHVVVGSDGIKIRGMWKEPFIRYDEIGRVEQLTSPRTELSNLVLHLRTGKQLLLPTVAIGRERITGLIERIERARRAASEPRRRVADALARGGKPLAAWRDELARLATRQPTFREAAIERDEIEGILDDPTASAEHRIGAAFVLSRIDPEAGQTRVRVAVETTAEVELREALLAASGGEIETAAVERSSRSARGSS